MRYPPTENTPSLALIASMISVRELGCQLKYIYIVGHCTPYHIMVTVVARSPADTVFRDSRIAMEVGGQELRVYSNEILYGRYNLSQESKNLGVNPQQL